MDATKAHREEEEEEEDQEDQEDVILFFGRRATPGKCKTRLAKDLTRILMVNEEEEEEEKEGERVKRWRRDCTSFARREF